MKLYHLLPHLRCSGHEYNAFVPLSLVTIGSSYDIIEIWLLHRLGVISVWEERITLNDADHTTYRAEYRPEIIRAGDCRVYLAKYLDRNSDLFDSFSAEQIRLFRNIIESR